MVKDITMGCVPAGVIPKYRFGAVSATLSRTFMHAPSAEPQKMDQVDVRAIAKFIKDCRHQGLF